MRVFVLILFPLLGFSCVKSVSVPMILERYEYVSPSQFLLEFPESRMVGSERMSIRLHLSERPSGGITVSVCALDGVVLEQQHRITLPYQRTEKGWMVDFLLPFKGQAEFIKTDEFLLVVALYGQSNSPVRWHFLHPVFWKKEK